MSVTMGAAVSEVFGAQQTEGLLRSVPAQVQCYRCGAMAAPATDDLTVSVIVAARDADGVPLITLPAFAHARCCPGRVFDSADEFRELSSRRPSGIAVADSALIVQGKAVIPLEEPAPSFTCPECKAVSYLPYDIRTEYCGACNKFQGWPDAGA